MTTAELTLNEIKYDVDEAVVYCLWGSVIDGLKKTEATVSMVRPEGWISCNCTEHMKLPTRHWCSHLNHLFHNNLDTDLAGCAKLLKVPIDPSKGAYVELVLKDVPVQKQLREVMFTTEVPHGSLVECSLGYYTRGESISSLRSMFIDWFRSMRSDADLFYQKCRYQNHAGFIKTAQGKELLKGSFVDAVTIATAGYCSACVTLNDKSEVADSLDW